MVVIYTMDSISLNNCSDGSPGSHWLLFLRCLSIKRCCIVYLYKLDICDKNNSSLLESLFLWVVLMRIEVGKTASNRLGVELTHNKMNNIEFEPVI